MPIANEQGRWIPKAFRPESLPTKERLADLVSALPHAVSDSSRQLLERLAYQPPLERFLSAVRFTLLCMERNPGLSSVLQQALTLEEYATLTEVASSGLTAAQKATAEQLLCVRERELVSAFFRRAFRILEEQSDLRLHLFDNLSERENQ
jgi:hypothetical protein